MNPVYTQRKGTTYAMSETDLMHISTFTAASSRLYSLSGFLVGVLLNIIVSYGGATGKLSPLADFGLHKGSWILVIAAFVFFVWGHSFTRDKNAVIDQIRRECGVEPKRSLINLCGLWTRRPLERLFGQETQSPGSTTHAD